MKTRCFLPAAIALIYACSPPSHHYVTSLQVYKDYDSTRTFHPYRPVKIDLYYPSESTPAKAPLSYGDILDMYEQRMDYAQTPDSCKRVSLELAKMFAGYLHLDDATKLLSYRTGIYDSLPPATGKFPLIIYASSMNGSSWENPLLFDTLTKQGYVVACVSSVGKYPGFMVNAEDLDEQVQDIFFTLNKVKQLPWVDTTNIGLLSWSLGGSAITKAAMLYPDFKCLLSYDGTEIHDYGMDSSWDRTFDQIRQRPPADPSRIHIPYMYLRSEHPDKIDSTYNLQIRTASTVKYALKLKHAIHEDFSSLSMLVKKAAPAMGNIDSSRHEYVQALTSVYFNQYLKGKGNTGEFIKELYKKGVAVPY